LFNWPFNLIYFIQFIYLFTFYFVFFKFKAVYTRSGWTIHMKQFFACRRNNTVEAQNSKQAVLTSTIDLLGFNVSFPDALI